MLTHNERSNTVHRGAGWFLGLALSIGLGWWPLGGQAEPLNLNRQAEEVAERLMGVLDTAVQAKTNPQVANVRMVSCRVTLVDAPSPEGIWLYQEQAIATNLQAPYRQRFLHITPRPLSQVVRSLAYRPSNPNAWVNLCDQPVANRNVTSKDLGEAVCSVFLKRSGDVYIGVTPAIGCPTTARGAIRTTNRVILRSDSMETWDRGYNAQGQQVWGAEGESYQFRRNPTSK